MKMNYNLADIDLEYLFGEISHQRRCFIGIRSLLFMVRFSVSAGLIKSLGSQH